MKICEILYESSDMVVDSQAWDLKLRADRILYYDDSIDSIELEGIQKEIFKFILAHGDQLLSDTLNQLEDAAKQLKELENNNEI